MIEISKLKLDENRLRPIENFTLNESKERSKRELDYYIYSHLDDNGRCFYIGKGKGVRCFQSRKRSDMWAHIANKGYSIKILVSNINHYYANAIEAEMIKEIQPITNILLK